MIVPNLVLAQATPLNSIDPSANQTSLLSRIYASDVTITSPANSHSITGTFTIRNSESASVGNIQYETMLLSPLSDTQLNQLSLDNPDVYDRIRSKDIINLKANEQRTITFSYNAPNIPQGSYRIRIQIVTTNDRKLGWDDATITLGGANGFFIIQPQSVNVDSSDPLTKEHNTTWDPLYGVNVNPSQHLTVSATLKNPGTEKVSGIISISTKRLLYANETPSITQGSSVTIAPASSQQIQIPLTTQKIPGAYIILVTLKDASGTKISGVAEYRYVVRGESASVVSAQIQSIPSDQDKLAEVNFVLAGSADRNTPVAGNVHIAITDNKGEVGALDQKFSMPSVAPITGTAHITMLHTICGTPTVTITLTNASKAVLDKYLVSVPSFANPSCNKPILSYITKPILNILIAIAIIVVIIILYKVRSRKY